MGDVMEHGSQWRFVGDDKTIVTIVNTFSNCGDLLVVVKQSSVAGESRFSVYEARAFRDIWIPIPPFSQWFKELVGRKPRAKEVLRAILKSMGRTTVSCFTTEEVERVRTALENWERCDDL